MAFLKIGELVELTPANIESSESVTPLINESILANFAKTASQLKRIAPKAEDFLYFSAVMMHAAEAALLNEDGTPKMTSKGKAAEAHWDKTGGSWRWKSNDSSIKPYRNSNGDIFPEEELVKAYKKWIGKPLCIDHKSSSVDHVRGFIVDTYYDRQLKRVIALCALDKCNYPDLARKVSTGYSNSVSMGTAVGKAICSDCGTVAKVESDFCKCMRGRTCYGEINVDLNPIELSIVVNGADPLAKIKHIVAAANSLASYVELKNQELKKVAGSYYANIGKDGAPGGEGNVSANVNIKADSLDQLKSDIDKALLDFEHISAETQENMSADTNDTAYPQTESSVSMVESDLPSTDQNIAPPVARFASNEANELNSQLKVIKSTLDSMQYELDKLAQFTSNLDKKEEIMSGNKDLNKQAYFQGGGEGNEPTPGQVRYEKDPLNEQLRNNEDRQMVGQKPFPEVGPVDGMYPGYDSFDRGELDRKKMLARAEAEERAIKRAAFVASAKARAEKVKEAYFLGGGDVNEPTPGKVKYPVDKLNDQLRDKEDKQMVGQKPFPGVGDVEGLHPSPESADDKDELKRKEKLLRAGLKARFVKAAKEDGSLDAANSAWEVLLGDKLLLTASVGDITGGKLDLYSAVATKEYGTTLIGNVRKLGAEKVAASLSKKAQDATMPAPAPEAPALPAAPDAAPADLAQDSGKEGDPKESALELSEKVKDLASDLDEAVKALTGEQSEMGDLDAMKADDSKLSATASLNKMRKELNVGLTAACKDAVDTLRNHHQELNVIVAMYDSGSVNAANRDMVNDLVEEAVVDAKAAFADSCKLLGAFVKYARGTDAIVKRAQEAKLNGEDMNKGQDSLMAMVDKDCDTSAADAFDAMLAEDMASADSAEETTEDDDNNAGMVETPDATKAKQLADQGLNVRVTTAETKEGRAAARAKLAAEMKWNPVMNDFHKHLEDPTFDTKPSDNGGHFETIDETHEAMLDVAKAAPKVRKEAETIHTLITQGKLAAADLDLLVANGVDPEVVKYYKAYYGQAGSEGSQFAAELVKEHAKAQAEEDKAQYRVKIARAYELAYEMVDRELLPRERTAITAQVDDIMKWNDESFESVKRVVASQKPALRKSAGRMPQVGIVTVSDNSQVSDEGDLASQLSSLFSKSSKRSF